MASVQDVVRVLTRGAAKYGDENWRQVPNGRERYVAALYRHLASWRLGELNDPGDGLPHLAHAMCCALFLAEFERDRKEGK